ncbi:MAG: hemerythrin domain-containing protein [Kofleriaceae bacterium]
MVEPVYLVELVAQHATLRTMIDRCLTLADELDTGAAAPELLAAAVTRLRRAFEEHNRFEEDHLRPALLATNAFEAVQIETLIGEHVREHRELRGRIVDGETALLRDVVDTIRAHLDAEERFLLR